MKSPDETPSPIVRACLAFAEGFAQLAAHFGAPAGAIAVEAAPEAAPEAATPAEKEENPAPTSVSAPEAEKAPETAISEAASAVPAEPPAPLTEDGLRQLVIRAFESGHGDAVKAFLAAAGVQRVTQLDEAGRQALADKLAGEGVARC